MSNPKVTKRLGHDNMSMVIKFQSGATLDWKIGRGGEKLAIAFSNNKEEVKQQIKIVEKFLKGRKSEDNKARFLRLEETVKGCRSGKEFIAKIS